MISSSNLHSFVVIFSFLCAGTKLSFFEVVLEVVSQMACTTSLEDDRFGTISELSLNQ